MLLWFRKKLDSTHASKVEAQLRAMTKVSLPPRQRLALKQRILAEIQHQQSRHHQVLLPQSLRMLSSQIENIGEQPKLSVSQRVAMKERVLAKIRKTDWLAFGPFRIVRTPHFFRTVVSSTLLLFFVVTSVLIFPFQVQLTYAARLTYIDEVSGQVFVLRQGKLVEAVKDFTLLEGDVLITKENSFVTVRFFDDSVSRLDANTQLEVDRLYSEPFNPVATQVDLMLKEGHMWTRVLNLIDENSHFKVETQSTAATVTKKAAFDLQTHLYSTTLSVFDNMVDFALRKNVNTETRSVLSGFQAEVSEESGSKVAKITPVVKVLKTDAVDPQWVASNQQKDELHAQFLTQEKAVPESPNTKALSNPAIESERLRFVESYKNLLAGENYLNQKNWSDGMHLVLQFKAAVSAIMTHYPDFQKQDPLNASLLFSFMQGKVAEQRKNFATLLPGDPLYPVKEELENAELLLAGSGVDKAKLQLSQSEDKLLEVQDLVTKNNFDQAQSVLFNYEGQIDNLVVQVDSDNVNELQDNLGSLFDHQLQQIKVLTSIEKSLDDAHPELLKKVRDIRQKVLEKLMAALEKVHGDVPVSLLQELQDLLKTYYVHDGARDESFIGLLNSMLAKYANGTVIQDAPPKIPTELGLVTIVPPVSDCDASKQTCGAPILPVPSVPPKVDPLAIPTDGFQKINEVHEGCGLPKKCGDSSVREKTKNNSEGPAKAADNPEAHNDVGLTPS